MNYDLIVVGSGAAGLSAGIYAGRYRLKTAVFGDEFGGLNTNAGNIQNYPGYVEIDGLELVMRMKEQALIAGAEVIDQRIMHITKADDGCFFVQTEKGDEHHATAIILATGSAHRHLGLPHEKEWTSKGIHYCTVCDAPLYGDKTIAIVGGGDGAIKGASLAAEYAKKMYILVRGPKLRAEPINIDALMKFGEKVQILYETQVTALLGTDRLEGITLSRAYQGVLELSLDGLFIEIGQSPRVELAQALGVSLDATAYINTDATMKTNIEGVFVAGDVSNLFGTFRQDITVAAMGAVAATSAYQYIKKHGVGCKK
ncbi:FAD-dependent oxidoreductase [Candidatus Uhrbacteria bacterium]|nr:FAD-dependent oxidoreductase [Candidatus Uhrbacteria bacterium]